MFFILTAFSKFFLFCFQRNVLSRHLLVQSQQLKHQTMREICSKTQKKNVGVVLVTLLITCKLTTNMKQVKCVRRRNLKKVLEMRKSTLEVNLSQRKLPRSLVHTRRYIVSLLHTKNQLKLKTLKFLFHRT